MVRKTISAQAALERMIVLCSRSEQCTEEVTGKLRKLGVPSSEAKEIVRALVEERYVDDARYAKSFAYSKMQFSGWGKKRIRLALMQKRIVSDLITDALDSLDNKEYDAVFRRVLESKAKRVDLDDYATWGRIYRAMVLRGFEPVMISRGLMELKARGSRI